MKLSKNLSPEQLLERSQWLKEAGRLEEATLGFEKLQKLYPKFPPILNDLGILYLHKGRFKEGVELLEKSLRIDSKQPFISFNLGRALLAQGKFKEAAHLFHHTKKLKPEFTEAYFNEAYALFCLEKFEESQVLFQHLVSLNPNSVEAINGLGISLYHSGKYNEALKHLKIALNINSQSSEIHNNIGLALHKLNHFEEAIEHFSKAIALTPMYADAISNRGLTFQSMRKVDDALKDFNNAITINPNHADAQWNKSLLEIMIGNFQEGWLGYEWRWKSYSKKWARTFKEPLWLGQESLKGKTIYIYPEQGFGDFIQFCRFVPMLLKLDAQVILEAPPLLTSLALSLKGNIKIIKSGELAPYFDYQCPMMSLPLAFKTTLDTIPQQVPYLFAYKEKKETWNTWLGIKKLPRIGLAWSGAKGQANDHNRSMKLENLLPLLELPFEFHSLQKEIRAEDEIFLEKSLIKNHRDNLNDFSDTAALAENMDLVISVDTSIAHLAGALNKQLFVLLAFNADYRWLLNNDQCPWYPNATLLRQSKIGDWGGPINDLIKTVEQMKFNF
jgi:tetratricopeptide (TPR) repeat protein